MAVRSTPIATACDDHDLGFIACDHMSFLGYDATIEG